MISHVRQMSGLFCVLLLAGNQGLFAWNATGHKSISFLTYSLLTPRTKQRVDAILRMHPDYTTILAAGTATDPVDIAHNAFSLASTWPDVIKSDPRFSDSATGASNVLPGFPDMLRHQSWHYVNTPFPDEFAHERIDPVNAPAELKRLLKMLHKNGAATAEEAFALPWIIHLETDLHQPLHTVSRFYRSSSGVVEQDKGGNACYIDQQRNLHALWDSILGTESDEKSVARLAASLQDHYSGSKKPDLKVDNWIREGVEVARSMVYGFAGNCLDREHPTVLPPDYRPKARAVAVERASVAAYRLAALLNDKLD